LKEDIYVISKFPSPAAAFGPDFSWPPVALAQGRRLGGGRSGAKA